MKKLFSILLVPFICFILAGNAFAADNAASVSLDSPGSSQSFKPGDNVEISGNAQNINQVSILVCNAAGSIAYVAQPSVTNGIFSTEFKLNSDAAAGQYTIRIGAKELAAPVDFTFNVVKSSTGSSGSSSGSSVATPTIDPATGAAVVTSGGGSGGSIVPTNQPVNSIPEQTEVISTPSVTLNDITGHWAESNINKLVARGAISGYPDGSFKPDNTINRAEFAVVLVKAFKLEMHSDIAFKDTSSHWARDYIAALVGSGVANGYDADTFGPDDPITREQMAVMLVKAAGLEPLAGEISFSDSSNISSWAREAIATLTQKGFMQGTNNAVKPLNNATRGEVATLIMNVLNTL